MFFSSHNIQKCAVLLLVSLIFVLPPEALAKEKTELGCEVDKDPVTPKIFKAKVTVTATLTPNVEGKEIHFDLRHSDASLEPDVTDSNGKAESSVELGWRNGTRYFDVAWNGDGEYASSSGSCAITVKLKDWQYNLSQIYDGINLIRCLSPCTVSEAGLTELGFTSIGIFYVLKKMFRDDIPTPKLKSTYRRIGIIVGIMATFWIFYLIVSVILQL